MKSSTLRRSTLSKETIDVIESLAANEDSVGEYLRPDDAPKQMATSHNGTENKAKEIDLLWQNFKVSQFNTKSPFAYILMGFSLGVLVTLLIGLSTMNYVKNKANKPMINIEKIKMFEKTQIPAPEKETKGSVNIPGENEINTPSTTSESQNSSPIKGKKYVVKDGDTGAAIIQEHYGAYTPEREELIKKANNLQSLDKLSIGQELVLPSEK